jgi:hypothetical protein
LASALPSVKEDLHLVGDRGHVHHFGHVGMEALERAARRFGIEGARRGVMGAEIIEQGAGDRGLSDAPFVGADENDSWSGHRAALKSEKGRRESTWSAATLLRHRQEKMTGLFRCPALS